MTTYQGPDGVVHMVISVERNFWNEITRTLEMTDDEVYQTNCFDYEDLPVDHPDITDKDRPVTCLRCIHDVNGLWRQLT